MDGNAEAGLNSVNAREKEALFISAMPASRSNAIGVQTIQFSAPFGDAWKHCYWDTNMGRSEVPNSICLNSAIPRLWPFVTGRGFLTRLVERSKLSWWRGDSLLASRKPQLQRMLQDVGFAYAAPLRNSEATRCREIIEAVQRPFVVHLWDIPDESLNADYAWLFSHAERVFCLSEPMMALVRETARCETGLLSFVRSPSKFRASHRGGSSIEIGLIGFLAAYREGLELAAQAIESLHAHYSRVTLRYIGPSSQLEHIPEGLRNVIEYDGSPDDDERDRSLAACDVAFLPGPLLAPAQDQRSRYSVPSRIADYLAVGLPVIAAVHPDSATSLFCSSLRGRGFFPVRSAAETVHAVERLREREIWSSASTGCTSFFNQRCDAGVALNDFCAIAGRFL